MLKQATQISNTMSSIALKDLINFTSPFDNNEEELFISQHTTQKTAENSSLRDILTKSMGEKKGREDDINGNFQKGEYSGKPRNPDSDKNASKDSAANKNKTNPKDQTKRTHDPLLPPCKVCGAKASGIHFGAITCEACKVFFRRSMMRKDAYHCKNGGNCEMFPMRRITCSFCRLKKCNDLGMSRDGIQRGRYTVERKTDCIKKAKQFESNHKRKSEEHTFDISTLAQPIPTVNPANHTDAELEKLLKDVIKLDAEHLMIDENRMKTLLETQDKFLEYRKLKESVFGPMETLPVEEYLQVYRNTGIDLGNRREKFATCMINFVPKINTFTEYAKALPGFLELSPADQVTLSKESAVDWMFLSGYKMFNAEAKVFTCCTCQHTWPFEIMRHSRFSIQGYLASEVMKKLNLSNDELALLKALVVYSPDGSEGQIEDNIIVKKYQHQLTELLMATLRKNRQLDDSKLAVVFGQVVHALTEVKDASISFKQLIDYSLQLFPDVDYPHVLVELFSDMLKLETARAGLSQMSLSNSPPDSSPFLSETFLADKSKINFDLIGEFDSLLPQDVSLPSDLTDVPPLFPEVGADVFQNDRSLLNTACNFNECPVDCTINPMAPVQSLMGTFDNSNKPGLLHM